MSLAIKPVVWDFTSKQINLDNFMVLTPKETLESEIVPAVLLLDDVDTSDGPLVFTNAIELLKSAKQQLSRLGIGLNNIKVVKTRDGINFKDLGTEKSYPVEYAMAV